MTCNGISGEPEYDDSSINFLETLWGEGYMSPGGAEEVREVLDGIDLEGRSVLDIGCGAGGITLSLAGDYGAARAVGVDVEAPVLDKAQGRARDQGFTGRVEFIRIEPGTMPFPDAGFDIVFSKDAMIHVANKEALFRDIYRVLKPGGWLAASDWMISHDEAPSPEMQRYIEQEGHSFTMASPQRYRRAMEDAGFKDIKLRNRNPWYAEVARAELEAPQGELYNKAVAAGGRAKVEHNIQTWRAMLTVLESGEHCPHHLRGCKPA